MRLLVTRPREEAERTAERLRERGHDVLLAPMLSIEPVPGLEIPAGPYEAILITSGNAPRMLAGHRALPTLLRLPVFAVGRRTAEAARETGFADVTSADGDAADLVRLTAARFSGRKPALLYLAGDDRARDLPGELRPLGIAVETVVAYRALAAATLPSEIAGAVRAGRLDGVLHFSQRTAAIFLACCEPAGLAEAMAKMTHYCLSPRVGEPLRAASWSDIRVAPHPDEEALLQLIGPG